MVSSKMLHWNFKKFWHISLLVVATSYFWYRWSGNF